MNTKQAYNTWAEQYDTNINRTRDLEGEALRKFLAGIPFDSCLEIGCGTGKNTAWLMEKAKHVMAIDLSDEMLEKARKKITSNRVQFKQADITAEWAFADQLYDLVSFSLVLEHINNLDHVFKEASRVLTRGGFVYIGELHPYKQYTGTKARFDTKDGRHVVECFNHHISDFVRCSRDKGLQLIELGEYFDTDIKNELPRILTLLLQKVL